MIPFTTQYQIITKVFESFSKKKRIDNVFIPQEEYNWAKVYLNPKRYESSTITNFKVIVISSMFKNKFATKKDLSEYLNSLEKHDELQHLKLRDIMLSSSFHINKDKHTLEVNNEKPIKLFTNDEISVFGFNDYYTNNPDKVTSRGIKNKLSGARLVLEYFGFLET